MRPWIALFFLGPFALGVTTGCQLDHAGIGADGGRGEAGLEGGPRPATWCTTPPNDVHDFCADFDNLKDVFDRSPGAFCDFGGLENNCVDTTSGGAIALDTMFFRSAPNAMLATLPPSNAGTTRALLFRPVPTSGSTLTYAFDLRIDAAGMGSVTVGEIQLGDMGHRITLRVDNGIPDGGQIGPGLVVEEESSSGLSELPIGSVPSGTFVRISAVTTSAPNTVTVSIDGKNPGTLSIAGTTDTRARAISLGLVGAAPSTAWRMRYDNVTFDHR